MTADRRYWDSNAFLGWLNAERDKVGKCEGVLRAAEEGTIEIVTSAIALTEVITFNEVDVGGEHVGTER